MELKINLGNLERQGVDIEVATFEDGVFHLVAHLVHSLKGFRVVTASACDYLRDRGFSEEQVERIAIELSEKFEKDVITGLALR